MPTLRRLSGRETCKILGAHVEVRQRGSHIMMQRRAEGMTTTIPAPGHRELRLGTLASIVRQSGLPRSLFEVG